MMRSGTIIGGVTIVLVGILSLVSGSPASALSNVMPDPSEYGSAGSSIGLVLAKGPNVTTTSINVPLYVRNAPSAPPGNVTISFGVIQQKSPSVRACVAGQQFGSSSGSFTISGGSFAWDPVNQLWRAMINVSMCNTSGVPSSPSSAIIFRLAAPTSNYIINYTPPGGGGLFTTDASAGSSGFSNYTLPFATPCNITSDQAGTIRLDDLDSGTADNNWGAVSTYVTDVFGNSIPVSYSGGNGNAQSYYLSMTYQPGRRYLLHIGNVYQYNVLIYRMPHDNIAYVNGCPSYAITPTSAVKTSASASGPWNDPATPGKVRPGTWLRWSHSITGQSGGWYGRNVPYTYGCSVNGTPAYNTSPSRSVTLGMTAADNVRTVNDPSSGNCATPYLVKNSDIGKTFCHWVSIYDADQNGTDPSSTPSCVTVYANGGVEPILTTDPGNGSVVMDGSTFTARFAARNNTSPALDSNVEFNAWIWYEKQLPDRNYNPPSDIRYYDVSSTGGPSGSGAASPIIVRADGVVREISVDTRTVGITSGGRVCAGWRIKATSPGVDTTNSDWVTSCVVIGKIPTVQVWGNDVIVGSALQSSNAKGSLVMSTLTARQTVVRGPNQAPVNTGADYSARNWRFGYAGSLDFGPTASNAIPSPGYWPSDASEGVTVVSNHSGDLLFSSNGRTILDRNGNIMPNGNGLTGRDTATQTTASFPLNREGTRYGVVTNTSANLGGDAPKPIAGKGELYLTVVDMTLNGGLGDVDTSIKSKPLWPGNSRYAAEAMAAAPDQDGTGFWVYTFTPGTSNIFGFHVDLAGNISAPVMSSVGPNVAGIKANFNLCPGADVDSIGYGTIDFDPSFTRMAIIYGRSDCPADKDRIGEMYLLDVNLTTGQLTRRAQWTAEVGSSVRAVGYGAAFSPDGRYLYVTHISNSFLTRYNVDSTLYSGQTFVNASTLIRGTVQQFGSLYMPDMGSTANGGGAIHRGPNGKMYIANRTLSTDPSSSGSISVIDNPNAATVAGAGFTLRGIPLTTGTYSRYGLPQMVIPYLQAGMETTIGHYTGSWGEYSVVAPNTSPATGTVRAFASGSGLSAGTETDTQTAWSRLTFANTPLFGNLMPPTGLGTMPDIGYYLTRPGLRGVAVTNVGATSIGGGGIDPATLRSGSRVINASGPVTIAADLIYDNSANAQSMNQVVIIAPQINILGSVKRIDAWLITPNGTINTCSDGPAALTINECNQPLQINGALTANKVLLRRTAGSDSSTALAAAETINLRGDAYIWVRHTSELNGSWTTRSVKELPPRY